MHSLHLRPLVLLFVLAGCASAPAPSPLAEEPPVTALEPRRPVHTFSIVARDPETGELGVAVQSHWFGVGALVPWAEAGVGAVATQSFVNPSFGPRGLAAMRAGSAAPEVLAELVASDEGRAVRQVALVDARGRVAAHTGERCIAWAGHTTGEGWSVQANMMRNERVVPAMAKAFEETGGALAHRLVAALEAGQAAGGDLRGKQSAALVVVRGAAIGEVWRDRLVDLRVEDHATPIAELRRLYTLHTAYERMNAGDAALEAGDMERALAEYAAARALAPEHVEIVFWHAFTLATNDRLDESLPLFREVFARDASWIELLRRLPAAGLCERATVEAVLAGAGAR